MTQVPPIPSPHPHHHHAVLELGSLGNRLCDRDLPAGNLLEMLSGTAAVGREQSRMGGRGEDELGWSSGAGMTHTEFPPIVDPHMDQWGAALSALGQS